MSGPRAERPRDIDGEPASEAGGAAAAGSEVGRAPARGDPDAAGSEVDPHPAGSEVDPHPAGSEVDRATAIEVLRNGTLDPVGRITTASNITLLCTIGLDDPAHGRRIEATCVYKPVRGEAPLWDFPDGTLANRELAAFLVSEESGWDIVPPTVVRDGPYGPGMVQLWMDVDDGTDVVEMIRHDHRGLRPMAIFDAVVNNADRKAGHILPMSDGAVHGVDHGVCFSDQPKLRTVLWGWMGTPMEPAELDVLGRLREAIDGALGGSLRALLTPREVSATRRRVDRLIADGCFPSPDPDRPAIPWPWY
jgi:uncharacterized repeat protein (TIGR03843 family)